MSELTFAEAMAMDPSEVEVMSLQGTWLTVDGDPLCWTMAHLRKAKFRRARPKRSRVQEMAEAQAPAQLATALAYEYAIRAVCEWLRSKRTDLHEFKDVAPYIEREFLEPR